MKTRKILLRFFVAGDSAFKHIPNTEILELLLFLEQTLDLSSQDRYEQFPENLFDQLTQGQKHRFKLCLDRIKSNRTYRYFEAFHEVYDFIQNDRINNEESFFKTEIVALKHLHDHLKKAILENNEVTTC